MNPACIGSLDLAAWQVAPGVCWVQTRDPKHARRLAQRSDSGLVARGVAGGYLRTFEFRHGLAWAGRLIARYTGNGTTTNAGFSGSASPNSAGNVQTEYAGASIETEGHHA